MKLIQQGWKILPQKNNVFDSIELAARTCYKSEGKATGDSEKFVRHKLIKTGHYAMLEHGTVYLIGRDFEDFHYKYHSSPYSRVIPLHRDDLVAVTTNYRVLIENDWEDDLKFAVRPTFNHEPRVSVKFICSRAIANELVRHRAFSFAQESTRWCNYGKEKFGKELTFIAPEWLDIDDYKEKFGIPNQDKAIIRPDSIGYPDRMKDYEFLYALAYAEEQYMKLVEAGCKAQDARDVLPLATKTEIVMTGFLDDWSHFFDLRASFKFGSPHPDMLELAVPLKEEFKRRGWV